MLEIGKRTTYTFTGPWATSSGIFTLESISSGRVLAEMGADIRTSVFLANSLTEDDYETWVAGTGLLYVFSSTTGTVKVPDDFVDPITNVTTIDYQQSCITIGLGYLTDTETLLVPAILATIKDELEAEMGVLVTAVTTPYGAVIPKTVTEDAALVLVRSDRRTAKVATYEPRSTLVSTISHLSAVNDGYATIIRDKVLTTP